MNKLTVKGIKQIENMKFHDIEGGFGEGKKSMLAKEIATIHNRQEMHINEVINNNIKRFKNEVDIVNLLGNKDFKIVVDDLGLKTSNRQKCSYLLSERGYAKLLKILEDDVAWEQYEKLVDGYFNMRSEQPKLSKELQAIFMIDGKQQELEQEIGVVKDEVRDLKDNLPLLGVDCEEITNLIKKVCTKVTGYKTPAYKDKSLRGRVYSDIYGQVKREFQVKTYKAIKRSQLSLAKEIISEYKAPTVLVDKIVQANNQISFEEVM